MKVIEPSVTILSCVDRETILQLIELAGRTCYKSEDKITDESCGPFVEKICNVHKHESVIEHASATVRIVCDRGVTHEIVRHRIGAYSQESTRYCNYSKGKFGQEITVVRPCFWPVESSEYNTWISGCKSVERTYMQLLEMGASPQEARSVLPNSLKTEIVVTYNMRQWRHFFKMRIAESAHPQMRQVAIPLFEYMKAQLPELFNDMTAPYFKYKQADVKVRLTPEQLIS